MAKKAYIGVLTETGTETKPVAREIKKGYVGVEQAASYALVSNGTRDFTDGSISVTSFSAYQINSNGTLTPSDPTTTTLDELWQYVESGANDLYFCLTGESPITECYQIYDYYEDVLGDHTEYVYAADVFTVTGTGTVQVARKIKKAYIGIGGVARPCWAGVDPVFSNNTWEQIIDACQNGSVPDTWLVGDQKTMTINGIDYAIDIIGKHHDTYANGSGTAPLTFQLHDCYGTEYGMNTSNTNSGGWESSNMRATVLPSIMALMPPTVQSAIREVSKKTSAGSQSTTIHTTADKLFLLSEVEIFGSSADKSVSGEGTQYEYYSAGNSKVKNFNGSADYWWERSPRSSNNTYFCLVSTTGWSSAVSASGNYGVAFAFCF